jgi:membrane-associated phospholipid phosphatase
VKRDVFTIVVRIALAIGGAIDAYVAVLSLFAPQLIPPLLDIPVKDPALVQIAGGEYLVAAFVYALAFRDPVRFRVLLWLCALDQTFAVVLPWIAVAHGALPATWKIVAPIPFQAVLCVLFVVYAARPGRNRSATPFMQ